MFRHWVCAEEAELLAALQVTCQGLVQVVAHHKDEEQPMVEIVADRARLIVTSRPRVIVWRAGEQERHCLCISSSEYAIIRLFEK